MKKILCLAITVAMILSFAAIPAFADAATMTLAVTGDTGKVDDIITMTCTIKGVTTVFSWQCVFNYDSSVIAPYDSEYSEIITNSADAVYALTSHVFDEATAGSRPKKYYGNTGVSFENNKFTVYASTVGGAANVSGSAIPVSADGYTVFTATFKRIATDDIGLAFDTVAVPKVESTGASGNVLTSSSIDYTAPGGSDVPVDWKTTVGTEAPAEASFDAADLQFKKDPAAPEKAVQKKVTVFAKNTTGATLKSKEYGVQIGNAYYPGVGDVENGKYWAVILVDTDGTFLNAASYQYTAKVGSEEAAAGTVNVQ